jgi:hypothetical protein
VAFGHQVLVVLETLLTVPSSQGNNGGVQELVLQVQEVEVEVVLLVLLVEIQLHQLLVVQWW